MKRLIAPGLIIMILGKSNHPTGIVILALYYRAQNASTLDDYR